MEQQRGEVNNNSENVRFNSGIHAKNSNINAKILYHGNKNLFNVRCDYDTGIGSSNKKPGIQSWRT